MATIRAAQPANDAEAKIAASLPAAQLLNRSRVASRVRKIMLALGATAALTGGTTFVLAQASAQQEPVFSVYPVPGTLTAGEKTTISFRGGDADAIGTVTVRGSRSGNHPGKLEAHSDGQGASFIPDEPFDANEKVSVSTDRNIVGTSSGDFSINIGDETTRKARPVELPNVGRGGVQSFATRPDLDPPAVTVTTAKPGRAPGLVFLAPKAGRGQDGPMIINDKGQTVWFKSTPGKIPADFRVQQLGGKPVLTWWEGQLFVGDGDGVGQVYDQNYKRVATVTAGNGYSFDLHEFTLTPQNTAVVLSYERFKRDLRPWGGPRDARIVDNVVQEIDLRTGAVLFEWHSFGNVSPKESNVPPPTGAGFEWEYFHVNSAEIMPDGNFLISARNTSGDLQDRPPHGQDPVEAGRQGLDVQARQGRALRLAAQRSPAGRRHDQHLRQLGRAAQAQELARADRAPGRAGQDGHARARAQAPARVCSRPARATSRRCRTATCLSAGARSAGSPSSTPRATSSSTAASPAATTTTARSATRGSARRRRRPRSSPPPTAAR